MRKSSYKIIVEINNFLFFHWPIKFSINEIAIQNKVTWRTAKQVLETLCDLGTVERKVRENGTRDYFISNILKGRVS